MTARITSRQKQQVQKLVGDALTSLNPTKDGAQCVLGSRVFQRRFKELFIELAAEYYPLFSDDEALAWIVKYAKKSKAEAQQIVDGFRKKAREAGVADEVLIHAMGSVAGWQVPHSSDTFVQSADL